jgi:hypothetical protein
VRLLPFAALATYGVAFAIAALGGGLLVFDDHPGQLYRVWHVVIHGPAPWAWNAGWWAGYPELQFYPPGFAYAGALLHLLSLGRLSVEMAYQVLVGIAYLAPGFAAFALLSRLLGSGWAALPGALVALALSAGIASGVEGGVRTGMLAARLGWALLPLVALAVHGRAATPVVSMLLAAIAITHPAHLPTAAAIVLLAAWPRRSRWWLPQATVPLALGAALTGFWTVPLLARLAHTRALAWGDLAVGATLGQHPLLALLLVLALVAFWPLAPSPPGRDGGRRLLARLPWATGALVLADALGLEPLGARWLPANRMIDGFWLAVVLAGALTLGDLLRRLAARARVPIAALSVATVALVVAVSLPTATLSLWPRHGEWPALGPTARGIRLDDLWTSLAANPEGRVLFVRSGVPLVFGEAWWRPHTHVTALAPLATGRGIVHGTFTHPSPIAALVYRGSAAPGAIRLLAEQLDGVSLFGRPLEQLDTRTLAAYADRLGIAQIVALEEDAPRLGGLADDQLFRRRPAPAPFVVYARSSPVAIPKATGDGHLAVDLDGPPGTWRTARMAYYPLWRASAAERELPTRRGELGDLEIRVDGGPVHAELTYRPGVPELAGIALSALGGVLWVAAVVVSRRRAARS